MENWAISNFLSYDGGQTLVAFSTNNSETIVPASYFGSNDFASITATPPTYSALSALPIASQGWQKIFDQWKANGKVS